MTNIFGNIINCVFILVAFVIFAGIFIRILKNSFSKTNSRHLPINIIRYRRRNIVNAHEHKAHAPPRIEPRREF